MNWTMGPFTWASGKMAGDTERESKFGMMVLFTKGIGNVAWPTVKAG